MTTGGPAYSRGARRQCLTSAEMCKGRTATTPADGDNHTKHRDRKLRLGGTVGHAVPNHRRVPRDCECGQVRTRLISQNRHPSAPRIHLTRPLLTPNPEPSIVFLFGKAAERKGLPSVNCDIIVCPDNSYCRLILPHLREGTYRLWAVVRTKLFTGMYKVTGLISFDLNARPFSVLRVPLP